MLWPWEICLMSTTAIAESAIINQYSHMILYDHIVEFPIPITIVEWGLPVYPFLKKTLFLFLWRLHSAVLNFTYLDGHSYCFTSIERGLIINFCKHQYNFSFCLWIFPLSQTVVGDAEVIIVSCHEVFHQPSLDQEEALPEVDWYCKRLTMKYREQPTISRSYVFDLKPPLLNPQRSR